MHSKYFSADLNHGVPQIIFMKAESYQLRHHGVRAKDVISKGIFPCVPDSSQAPALSI